MKEKIPFKVYNSILNLQVLDKNENESKGQMRLQDWVDKECNENDTKERFLNAHIIPNISLKLDNLEAFFEERRKLLKKRLYELL